MRDVLLGVMLLGDALKVALGTKTWDENLGRKLYKNTKNSSLHSQSLLFFIHKTPVVESHPKKVKLEIYYGPGRHRRETRSIFYISSSLIYILKIHRRSFKHSGVMKTLWKIITYLLCYGI